jgi:DNA-binding NtrC family response regulator
MAKILLVDDEPRLVTLLRAALSRHGHDVIGVGDGRAAFELLDREPFDLVLTDLRMEPIDGMAVIEGVKERSPETVVIVLTAYGNVETAVSALQRGAYHYLTKPINFDEVAHVVELALGAVHLRRENRALRQAARKTADDHRLLGESPATHRLRDLIGKAAPSDATILIRGESGSGKEVVARALHAMSPRSNGPFVAVNCAAIAETLLESELFGHRKGAFTGADRDREGLFEAARGGTLLLDEIGEAGPKVQAKLLRVIESRHINRVGDPRERPVDVRLLAATNRSLEQAITDGGFRQDLYYRLQVFPIDVPPLRDRLDDLPELVAHFLERLGRGRQTLAAQAMRLLRAHPWPGNVRELRNLIERAHILAGDGPLRMEHLCLDAPGDRTRLPDGDDLNLDNNARRLILRALARSDGNKTMAAELLGITRRTLYSRLKLLGLDEDRHGP